MNNFDKAYSKTMTIEGGYVNDPLDKGGETYKGISRKNWPNWQGWVIVDQIKKEYGPSTFKSVLDKHAILQKLVKAFYKEQFWDKNRLDQLPYKIAEELFDTGVNMGASVAARFFQEALNLCNNSGKLYPNILVDGAIGPKTLKAMDKANTNRVFKTMNLLQGERYLDILRNNEAQEKFWGGWLERVIC